MCDSVCVLLVVTGHHSLCVTVCVVCVAGCDRTPFIMCDSVYVWLVQDFIHYV